jgi:PilZ domain
MPDQTEKRESERMTVSATTACTFSSPVLEDFGPLRVKNISTRGIGLVASEPLDAGLMLVVKLVNPAKNFAKTLLVRVVHVTPQGGSYLVGGTLDAPLSYEELCMLVM